MANHPVRLDMTHRDPPRAKPSSSGIKLYLIRREGGAFYFMARIQGFPNMRVAVTEKEAELWKGVDASLPLEERARTMAEERVKVWLADELRQRQWPA